MNLFPAILAGGPPHAGKSVLMHSLSKHLRQRNIAHYVLRATPDGEGDWSNEADWPLVENIRRKGQWTSRWVGDVCRAISNRHLPLLVDMGGRPTLEQEAILDQCNYAILLTTSSTTQMHWRALAEAHGLAVIADLHSELSGQNQLLQNTAPITGTIAGLQRSSMASGLVLDALVEQTAAIMQFSEAELWQAHQATAPWTANATTSPFALNFDQLPKSGLDAAGMRQFTDQDIIDALRTIPDGAAVCLHGRAPATMIAAVAFKHRVLWQFDARLGWVAPPNLLLGDDTDSGQSPVHIEVQHAPLPQQPARYILKLTIQTPPLSLIDANQITLPTLPPESEIVVDGIMPFWLLSAVAYAYRHCASVSAYQPQSPTARRT